MCVVLNSHWLLLLLLCVRVLTTSIPELHHWLAHIALLSSLLLQIATKLATVAIL